MGQLKISIVEGWTAAMDFQLYNDGAEQNLTGMSVSGVARNRLSAPVTLDGNVTVITATEGRIRLFPDMTDFASTESPYELRFAIADSTATDGSAHVAYWPNEEPILLIVRP